MPFRNSSLTEDGKSGEQRIPIRSLIKRVCEAIPTHRRNGMVDFTRADVTVPNRPQTKATDSRRREVIELATKKKMPMKGMPPKGGTKKKGY